MDLTTKKQFIDKICRFYNYLKETNIVAEYNSINHGFRMILDKEIKRINSLSDYMMPSVLKTVLTSGLNTCSLKLPHKTKCIDCDSYLQYLNEVDDDVFKYVNDFYSKVFTDYFMEQDNKFVDVYKPVFQSQPLFVNKN